MVGTDVLGRIEWVEQDGPDQLVGRVNRRLGQGLVYSRWAHINIMAWMSPQMQKRRSKGETVLSFPNNPELGFYWFATVDDAKRHAEAIYALEN
jgi:hypothetical protein